MSTETVHFIGVGGVGMSGIARVAHDQGMAVSGSDLKESRYTKQLRDAGITVFIGQDGANIPEGDPMVVVSTAILENNPELIAAKERGLAIRHRARDLKTLAVAGTHGKTTTSSMLASTLDAMGADPTFLIGGIVRAYGTNAHSGSGRYYVVEADESDKSFTYLSPAAAIVTNIEADHLDHYEGLDEIYAQFRAFLEGVREHGPVVVCGDDARLVEVARSTGRAVTRPSRAPSSCPTGARWKAVSSRIPGCTTWPTAPRCSPSSTPSALRWRRPPRSSRSSPACAAASIWPARRPV